VTPDNAPDRATRVGDPVTGNGRPKAPDVIVVPVPVRLDPTQEGRLCDDVALGDHRTARNGQTAQPGAR